MLINRRALRQRLGSRALRRRGTKALVIVKDAAGRIERKPTQLRARIRLARLVEMQRQGKL